MQESYGSLAGTQMNCSGGEMPWGSWVTCEETVNGYDVGDDFTRTPPGGTDPGPFTYVTNVNLQKRHGYIFEVPVHGEASAEPITQAGRFAHESVAWDPHTEALYLSEDNFSFPSGFYKYVPPAGPRRAGRLLDGGKLYMLKVKGVTNADLARHQQRGATFEVEWVRIDQPDFDFGRPPAGSPPTKTNDEAIQFVSSQGLAKGAAKFSRLEGTIYDSGWVYFTSTQGGLVDAPTQPDTIGGFGKGRGQIWGYNTKKQTLHMLFESPNARGARLPGQRHDEQARHAGDLRGRRRPQLPACADPQGRAVRHRPEPDRRPAQRRVRRVDVQPRRPHAVRQHPGEPRDLHGHLGSVGADRGLSLGVRDRLGP